VAAHSGSHQLWAIALAVLSLAGWMAIHDHSMRRRLRLTLVILIGFLGVHYAILYVPDVRDSSHIAKIIQGEWLLLALAVINALVAVVFSPWISHRARDHAPTIVQDAIVAIVIAGVAIFVMGNSIVTWSVGGLALIGFALQEQLGNLFAGLAVQVEKPFSVGHWITVAGHEGRVVEVTWRATKIKTIKGNLSIVPNSTIAREAISNYSEPEVPTRLAADVGASYLVAPNEVKDAMCTAMRQVPRVLAHPACDAIVVDFGSSAIVYRARFWIDDFELAEPITDEVRTAIYYEFKRRDIEIPWPIQVEYIRHETPHDPVARHEGFARTIAAVPVLAPLDAEVHHALAAATSERLFGDREVIVREGEPGASMFIVSRGRVAVTIGADRREVAVIETGGYFGEMSLLTGAPRSATVTARRDCTVLEITADAFRHYVRDHPEIIDPLAAAAEARRRELDKTRAAVSTAAHEHLSLKQRMRQFFGLA
jgi:small-conductance mechanosensitive channel/CRP-like cAMP-binding protein